MESRTLPDLEDTQSDSEDAAETRIEDGAPALESGRQAARRMLR